MKKLKKKLKGMTLVEVLVALAVFAIMSSLLASTVAMVCSICQKTDRSQKKISREVFDAEMQNNSNAVNDINGSLKIKIDDIEADVSYDRYKVIDPKAEPELDDFKYIKPATTPAAP